jgi:hypothetical protein
MVVEFNGNYTLLDITKPAFPVDDLTNARVALTEAGLDKLVRDLTRIQRHLKKLKLRRLNSR